MKNKESQPFKLKREHYQKYQETIVHIIGKQVVLISRNKISIILLKQMNYQWCKKVYTQPHVSALIAEALRIK